ncbi:adenylate/guanylate cyclase domain-containing protein [Bradyrhizobium sp. Tv2a-2]|uniref:adenylate/guanylate cyclase domain-containing protein n=1 Tax=Bradyrhizobium sp. Tv2a-2 TaxID=113395 RepID=UPI000464A3FB|nr:adenylate/guanylate cyclase domain-containing protein [Bradyrhizobium sp. Tv2a-2]
MTVPWEWKKIGNFGSLRERDCFVSWMGGQIESGISEEIEPPPDQPREPGDRWFRHIPTGSLWRLVPIDNSYGPGFWPAQDKPRVQRRLAAILAADVVGYSALMERDEEATYAEFERLKRELIEPGLSRHEGRLVKTTGDGALAEFASPLAAVRCAVEIQDHLASSSSPLRLRVGLNLGDVIVGQDGELYGDGTNIAVRLEGIADPGGILISEKVYSEIEGKLEVGFEDRGEQRLKNISRPVRAYAVRAGGASSALMERLSAAPLLPDKPSIAVLPFENMSGDPEQEYFADGMVEEIITALSRFKSLFVIARNSSFTFKGRAVDIKEVGRRLGVRYVLEGAVRKASGKVRITGQLIDAVTGAHIWADRFERDLTDVFALQDEVTVAVVSAIQPKLLQTEVAMAARRRPENLTAYDFYLRAGQQFYLETREGLTEAIRLAHRALELDPRFGLVAALAGLCHMQSVTLGYANDPQFDRKEAVRLFRLALSLDDSDPDTLAIAAVISAFMVGDRESEIEMADRAVALNPNSFVARRARALVYKVTGLPEEAVRSFECAMRLSPVDPLLHQTFAALGQALVELRRFDEAIVAGKKALLRNPSYSVTYRCLASAFAHLGRDAEAREAATRLLELDPAFTISTWIARGGQSNARLMAEGLRKAGLPE